MHADKWYLRWYCDFWPMEEGIEFESKPKIVTTKVPHFCAACNDFKGKEHSAGTRMIRETAKVDGRFSSAYTCLPCIEAWAKVCGGR